MQINILDEQSSLKLDHDQIKALAQTVISSENWETDEVTIHFVETQRIIDLHQEFFNDPTTTDCISFPMDEKGAQGYHVLGEIFVCPETAIRYAAENSEDPVKETALYVVHGLLHLMGYDDIDESDRMEMRAAEKRHMDHLAELGNGLCQRVT